MKKFLTLVSISFAVILICSAGMFSLAQTLPQLGKSNIKEVIAALTLEEKAKAGCGQRFQHAEQQAAGNDHMLLP